MSQAAGQVARGLKEAAMRMIMEHMMAARLGKRSGQIDPRIQGLQQLMQAQGAPQGAGPQGPQQIPTTGMNPQMQQNVQAMLGGAQGQAPQGPPPQPSLMDIFRQIFGNRPDMPELRD
jgi:hypothetical protein